MCYFRNYNKSSKWYPFTGLETYSFVHKPIHQPPHRQRSAAGQTRLRSDAASFEDHRSPALVYSLLYTASNVVVALFEEYG